MIESPTVDHPDADNDTRLRAGVELEIPFTPIGPPKWQSVGIAKPHDGQPRERKPEPTHEASAGLTWEHIGGSFFDKVRGYEVRTVDGGVPLPLLNDWYEYTYNEIEEEFERDIEPTGFFEDTSAGIHFHLSPISENRARLLWELSQEPWFQIFTASSIAVWEPDGEKSEKLAVARGYTTDFCRVDEFDEHHHSCVNKHRDGGVGHYEWRLPEPMPPEHFELLCEFIARFIRNTGEARDWAKSLVMERDERLTAIRRAKACGADLHASTDDESETTEALRNLLQ